MFKIKNSKAARSQSVTVSFVNECSPQAEQPEQPSACEESSMPGGVEIVEKNTRGREKELRTILNLIHLGYIDPKNGPIMLDTRPSPKQEDNEEITIEKSTKAVKPSQLQLLKIGLLVFVFLVILIAIFVYAFDVSGDSDKTDSAAMKRESLVGGCECGTAAANNGESRCKSKKKCEESGGTESPGKGSTSAKV